MLSIVSRRTVQNQHWKAIKELNQFLLLFKCSALIRTDTVFFKCCDEFGPIVIHFSEMHLYVITVNSQIIAHCAEAAHWCTLFIEKKTSIAFQRYITSLYLLNIRMLHVLYTVGKLSSSSCGIWTYSTHFSSLSRYHTYHFNGHFLTSVDGPCSVDISKTSFAQHVVDLIVLQITKSIMDHNLWHKPNLF